MFTNIFFDTKFIVFLKVLPPSQYFLEIPKPILIDYGQRNETANDIAIDKIKLYFKLLQRGIIAIWMKDYSIHNKTDKTDRLKELFEKWRIKKWDPQTQAQIIPMWFQKDTFFAKMKRRIFWIKSYVFQRPWVKFFVNDMLDEEMEVFMDNLDYGVDINMKMFDMGNFLPNIFDVIESYKSPKNKAFQAEELFIYIEEQIDWKKNFPWDMTISIPLKEYMDNKNFYYDILYQLHMKEYITLKEIYLLEQNITFIIHKIHSFERSILNTLFPTYDRVRFEWGCLYLDTLVLVSWKKKGYKNYELIELITRWVKKYKKLELEYWEIAEIFLEKTEDFSYIYNSINRKGVFERVISKLKETKNKEELNIIEKEFEKLISKTFNLSFFNSSLSVLWDKNFNFILKDNTTWIEFKGNL